MQHFATPLRLGQQTTGTSALRARQYKRKRKRSDDDDDNAEPQVIDLQDDARTIAPSQVQQPLEREQRRVAGLSSDDDDALQIPAPPFPHAPPKQSRPKFTSASVQQELANLSPAIYAADASSTGHLHGPKSDAPALRTTHLNVLSTVMHRCLLEGDYQRAARAWGMILRTQAHGTPIEPRYNGLWGLGAELLLHRKSGSYIFGEHAQDSQVADEHAYSDEGFQLAREYYERLILQYPIRKLFPHAIDATTFYPPLFSVWIMQVLQRSRRARQQLKQRFQDPTHGDISMHDDTSMAPDERRTLETGILNEELSGAREICQRLDQLVESPPYDKHAQLLGLRGHVGLWFSDLLMGNTPADEHDDWDNDSVNDEEEDAADSAIEKTRKCKESLREVKEAQEFFDRAASISNEALHETTRAVEKKIRDINKQMEKLRSSLGIVAI